MDKRTLNFSVAFTSVRGDPSTPLRVTLRSTTHFPFVVSLSNRERKSTEPFDRAQGERVVVCCKPEKICQERGSR